MPEEKKKEKMTEDKIYQSEEEQTDQKSEETAKDPAEETKAEKEGTKESGGGIKIEGPEDTKEEGEAQKQEPEQAEEADGQTEDKEEQPAAEENTKGRRFWQKQPKPPKKDKKDELIEELNDKVARQLAEFENFRKRTEKEKLQNYTVGARDVLEKILPVLDNFERGLEKADLSDPFAEGMDKVYKQLATTLEELGVTKIEAVGKEFDPNLHNAVMHIEDENLGENIVAEEFQKGYMYKDQVLRYSMVKVAN